MSVSHTNMLTYENSHGADGHLCPDCEEAFERFLDIHVDEVELA